MEQPKLNLDNITELMNAYNQLGKREIKKRRNITDEIYSAVWKLVKYKPDENKDILEHIFKEVSGVKELYTKKREMVEKGQKELEEFRRHIKEDFKKIDERLQVGDVLLDDDDYEWIVQKVNPTKVSVKKIQGKKQMKLQYDSYYQYWQEILRDEDEDEDKDKDDEKDALIFRRMMIREKITSHNK